MIGGSGSVSRSMSYFSSSPRTAAQRAFSQEVLRFFRRPTIAWVPPSPCLVLRLRCPLSRPGGEAAWPRGGSVLYGQQPSRAARPGSLSPPVSQRLAATAPAQRRCVCQRVATVPDRPRRLTQVAWGALSGSLSGRLAAGSRPGGLAGTRARWGAQVCGQIACGPVSTAIAGRRWGAAEQCYTIACPLVAWPAAKRVDKNDRGDAPLTRTWLSY